MLQGAKLKTAAVDFFNFPCSPTKRQDMVRAADALLSGVTRMLYIADIADALRLQLSLKQVSLHSNIFAHEAELCFSTILCNHKKLFKECCSIV